MRNKRFNFLIILLCTMFLFTSFSIEADQLYTTETAWEDNLDVYRPCPVLFLHGFAAGSPETWQKVVDNLKTHHFDFYYRGEKYGHSFGNKVSPYLESIQFFNEADEPVVGKNNSVDTYKAGDCYVDRGLRDINDPGGANKVYYWLHKRVPDGVNDRLSFLDKESTPIIGTYTVDSEKPKVNMICHSLGGLSARQFLKQYGDENVAKLITVGTPHLGSPLAAAAHGGYVGTQLIAKAIASTFYIPRLSKILIPKIEGASLWPPKIKIGIRKSTFTSYVSGIKNTRVNLPDLADIDIQGDAVSDLVPGCEFLNQLNSSVPGGPKYYCVYGQYSAIPYIHIGVNAIGGDMVVPVASQRADGVGIPWKEMKRIYTYHSNEGATLAENDCKTLLGFLDDTEPVLDLVRVLESKDINLSTLPERPEGDWDNEDTDWRQHSAGGSVIELDILKYGKVYIEGKVDNEYLPATSEVKIAVFKRDKNQSATYDEDELEYWGYESDDFGYVTKKWSNLEEAKETRCLKPYANQIPAPAGFRYKVEFNFKDPDKPEPGIYEAKVFVENPAGLKSEVKSLKVTFFDSSTGLDCGYWNGSFAFIHKNAYEPPMIYKHPNYELIDIECPELLPLRGNYLSDKWYYDGDSWNEIYEPDWGEGDWSDRGTSSIQTTGNEPYGKITKLGKEINVDGENRYYFKARIWLLSGGVWSYTDHIGGYVYDGQCYEEGWAYASGGVQGAWKWGNDICYLAAHGTSHGTYAMYCKNGVYLGTSLFSYRGIGLTVCPNLVYARATSYYARADYGLARPDGIITLERIGHIPPYYGSYHALSNGCLRIKSTSQRQYEYYIDAVKNSGTYSLPQYNGYEFSGISFYRNSGNEVIAIVSSWQHPDEDMTRIMSFNPITNSWTDYGEVPW
ncbi:MAG: hypothetical protein Q7J67_01380 [bacterium]|nr:hypothetical protein [bacterium]